MKKIVVSYSRTGNNNTLAASIASELSARHIHIQEKAPRSFFAIALDMLFNHIPKVPLMLNELQDHEMIIFIAPVWMGQVASPLRRYFKALKNRINKYVFVSISGGADGPNPKLSTELKKRLGKAPAKVINLLIADLLPADSKTTREMTEAYRLSNEEAIILARKCIGILETIEPPEHKKEKV